MKCPCHISEHTTLLLDAILGVCRICGNRPSPLIPITSCNPALPPALLALGKINPFGILPMESTPKVQELILHFTNTIASTATNIHSQGFTDPHWLTAAIVHPALFHVTLYVCSMHLDALNGRRESNETLWYKTETMRLLTSALEQEGEEGPIKDETIAAVVLLAHVLAVTGSQLEAKSHLKGLEQMINMRGGIQHVVMDSMLVQMLCTINHITAVLYENPVITPRFSQVPILPSTPHPHTHYAPPPTDSPDTPSQPPRLIVDHGTRNTSDDENLFTTTPVHGLTGFAIKVGLHKTMVQILDHVSFLHAVVDAFTTKYCPQFRREFEEDYM
ncbi:hypothetical protein BJ875DRAFT_456311 [Amylocarpus encephaloides]|uniref:Transcription factor domain-containing protein n=1 Tax=Amylocarpus encephaloides TaxID=45428 RepID=A0A9P7YMV2_9HELO|nr:hypothetical protein BJ875DRAFT_456311 [Amylocarpus encephaloides]